MAFGTISRTHFLSSKMAKHNKRNKVTKLQNYNLERFLMMINLQSSSTRDNLNEFSSKDSLPSSVVGKGQLVNHFTGVLAGVIHSSHPGRLLRACTFLQTVIDHGCQRVLHIRLNDIGVQGIVQRNLLGRIHSGLGENRQLGCLVRDNGSELIVVHFADIVFETTVQDCAGDFGSVAELGWQTTDFTAHA